jgi:ATP adenylyltransferase
MERLWTPWRLQYVSSAEQPAGCLFCTLSERQDDERSLLVKRGRQAFVLLNLYPYNTGHVMIAPYAHTADFAALAPEIGAEILALTQRVIGALSAEYEPDGFNVGMNLGRVAGAGIPDHLHVHVVPRWNGDTNFMPITAQTKVMPETLAQTYARLQRALAAGPDSADG